MSEERLQKLLARAGLTSRRKAEELIREGRVTVNGEVAGLGTKADAEADAVKVDGRRVELARSEHVYLLLNKPRGVMSTVSDPEGRPTVIGLVPPALRKALVPVGRLDFATEGLILLTDDGEFANRVAHPRYGCTKTYEVKVSGTPDEKALAKLRRGMVLEGKRTAPAGIAPRRVVGGGRPAVDSSWWMVELSEGRTRQIREMFFRVGHPVEKLRRVAIGGLADPHLPVGAVRELAPVEVRRLLRGRRPQKAGAGARPPRARREAPPRGADERLRRSPPSRPSPKGRPRPGSVRPSVRRRPERRPPEGRSPAR